MIDSITPVVALASSLGSSSGQTSFAGSPDLFSSAIKMISALAITLGILFFVFYLFRGFFSKRGCYPGSRGLIQVISTAYLGNKRSLVLADVAGEKFVLGLSLQGITLLARLDGQESLEKISALQEAAQPPKPFKWFLETIRARHDAIHRKH